MSRRWDFGDIADRFDESVAGNTRAIERKWDHISTGERRVATVLDLPELDHIDTRLSTVVATDYIELPPSIVHIYSVFDLTTSSPMHKEESLRHRARFLESDGLPPTGAPYKWIRAASPAGEARLYYRDRPTAVSTFLLDTKQLPDLRADEDRAKHPVTPAQYDEALLRFALWDYYDTARGKDSEETAFLRSLAQQSQQSAMSLLSSQSQPKAEEDKAQHGRMHQRGYQMW
jgi:hypothetical protein